MVQFELAFRLRDNEIDFWLEYSHRRRDFREPGVRARCRFDVVVLFPDKEEVLCIIEVKRALWAADNTFQMRLYRTFGVPVFMCRSLKEVRPTVAAVCKLLRSKGYERTEEVPRPRPAAPAPRLPPM